MQRWYSRLTGVSIVSLLILLSGLTNICRAGFLAEDSTHFANYWTLVESGESAAARDTLQNLGAEGHNCTEQMANFLMAWKAWTGGDLATVLVYLDLGTPVELTDYALWMRADALDHAGQDKLAEPYWIKLAADTSSVYSVDALYRLADHAFNQGLLDSCLTHAAEFAERTADAEDRQHVAFLRAQVLAAMSKHEEAVETLWGAYALAPLSGEAARIHSFIEDYHTRYGFAPRMETASETAQEYAVIEQGKQYGIGLERADRALKAIQPEQIAEVLRYFKGRFENALGHHRDAISTLQSFLSSYPKSPFRYKALYNLGRSAYLTDQDAEAIPALNEAGNQTEDLDAAGKALDLLGTLHMDRHRPAAAVAAYHTWDSISHGTSSEADCLWKLGRALWDAEKWQDAALAWNRLYNLDENSDYAPAALYWSARAARKIGQKEEATLRYALLESRFPYSYNAIIAKDKPDSVVISDHPLNVPSLDDLWESGGEHCKKFAMLTALRLSEMALRELPAARNELPDEDGLAWWKAQHFLWDGRRMAAWRVVLTELGTYLRTAGTRPPAFNAIAYPLDFDPQIIRLSRQYDLDPYFVFGLICQESHYEEAIVSPAGATGLMQLMPQTAFREARQMGIGFAVRKLRDPDYNLQLGTAHLARLFSDFNRDSVLVLAAYNAGPGAAQSWASEYSHDARDEFIEHIPYRETRMYVKRNIEHAAAYRRLYPDVVSSVQIEDSPAPLPKVHPANGVHKRRAH